MDAIRRILCPVDFSSDSAVALERAAVLARWYHARLTVLHVAPADGPGQDQPDHAALPGRRGAGVLAEHDVAAQAGLEVQRFVQVRVGPEVSTTTVVAEAHDAAAEIARKADQRDADLIVIGRHGRGGFEPRLLGSTADMVLRKSHCAVLTSPPGAAPAVSLPPFTNILCAVDGPPAASRAFDRAAQLAADFGADLSVLQVAQPAPGDPRDPSGCAAGSILRLANERRCDLIVVGTRNRGASDGFRVGRTTHQVVRAACCPVWTVPAD